MKSFLAIAFGALVGVANASPLVYIVADECLPAHSACYSGGECCNYQPCLPGADNEVGGACAFFGGGGRRINAPCEQNGHCYSGNCVPASDGDGKVCAPDQSDETLLDNGEDCSFDMTCKGGWCEVIPDKTSGVCRDRSEDPIDPRRW
eukprot:Clim_evm21s84 gene=Clim_evmTU21s84